MQQRLSYSFRIALPFLLAAGVAAVDYILNQVTTFHPSTTLGVLIVALALPIGDYVRAQLLLAESRNAPTVTPATATPTTEPTRPPVVVRTVSGPDDPKQAGISEDLMRALIEESVREHLAAHPPTPAQPTS